MSAELRRAAGRRPLLISFSGLDGSGKSTQIEHLHGLLAALGYRSAHLAFWDDVVVLTRYREGFVHAVYKSERGIGAPGKPVARRDKNVRAWYLTLARYAMYLLDALNLRRVLARTRRERTGVDAIDVIIIDRYIYDQLANLPLSHRLTRAYLRLVQAIVPRPDIAYLLDADPEAARRRKPEYPVEFMRECRRSYHQLAALLGVMTVIPPLPLEEAKRAVEAAWQKHIAAEEQAAAATRLDPASAA
jgi:thymidylate kinase